MSTASGSKKLLYWGGIALGPAAWGINLQAVYAIVHFTCSRTTQSAIVLSTVLAVVALVGTFLSARAIGRSAQSEWTDAAGGGPRNFMAWLGAGTGVLFAIVIANQLAAALVISPCLR